MSQKDSVKPTGVSLRGQTSFTDIRTDAPIIHTSRPNQRVFKMIMTFYKTIKENVHFRFNEREREREKE